MIYKGLLCVKTLDHPYSGSSGYVLEHRLVIEELLRAQSPGHPFLITCGKSEYLRPDISVHHIDENKRNNSQENLLACTTAAHRTIHNGEAPMKGHVWPEIEGLVSEEPYRVTVKCAVCESEFLVKRSDAKRGCGKYCSRKCYDNRERKTFDIKFII